MRKLVYKKRGTPDEGILEALVDAGMLTPTGETLQSGYTTLDVCRLASSHMALLKF